MGRSSPGALTRVHQREKVLRGKDGCAQCHGGWGTSMSDSCLVCHDLVGVQIENGTGLHGSLEDGLDMRCASCHSEHHGAESEIINRQSFARAGAPDPGSFDHSLVGFPMDGRHLELECSTCHEHAELEVLPKGEARFAGLDSSCAACHEDAHDGRMVVACASCHAQTAFDELGSLGHETYLSLEGGHADVDCATCHQDATPHSLTSLGRGVMTKQGKPPRGCVACHESPHTERFLTGTLALLGEKRRPEARVSCLACHEAQHESFHDEDLELGAEQHASSGFRLDPPHDTAACAACHASAESGRRWAVRFPGRGQDQCAACHEDPHGGQFETGPFAAAGCVACHRRRTFEPHAFDAAKHARAALPLDGRHAELDCNVCHQRPAEPPPAAAQGRKAKAAPAPTGAPGPRVFRGTPARCELCHEDGHGGFFEPFATALARVDGGSCAACHGTAEFGDVAAGRFDHGRWTGLDIHGAHAQTDCATCHPRRAPDDTGRTLGFVAEHFGTFEGCATCHEDPHRGEFDEADYTGTGRVDLARDGRVDCSTCHEHSSFRAFPRPFDHGGWTGFPLEGAHLAAECSSCHARQAPDELGRAWGRARGNLCSDCHSNPHAGQFRSEEGATDCRRCHQSAAGFDRLVFDHDRDSRFPLEESHARLACSACHLPWETGSGAEVVRYRPLGTACIDCHGAHDDHAATRRKR
jgi:hypothetical protein